MPEEQKITPSEEQEIFPEEDVWEKLWNPFPLKYCIPPKPGTKKGDLMKAMQELREVFLRIPGLKEEVERERAEQGLTKEGDISR